MVLIQDSGILPDHNLGFPYLAITRSMRSPKPGRHFANLGCAAYLQEAYRTHLEVFRKLKGVGVEAVLLEGTAQIWKLDNGNGVE